MTLERRALLKAAAGVSVVATPLAFLFRREARADAGPLLPDAARVLDLPAGFSYRILERASDKMSDGKPVPARPDGMACFPGPSGTLILMRNHELERSTWGGAPLSPSPEWYDRAAPGGVTRLVLDANSLKRVSSNQVLAGTLRNCSGGASPWGWLSCEENVEPGHGYVFRCNPLSDRLAPAERLVGYGRFMHEAACVDPRTLTAYLSEDRVDGCLYRYRPSDPSKPHTSGKLQALRVVGAPGLDASRGMEHDAPLQVDWVDIPNPDPRDDSVRLQAAEAGAARFCRGEGIVLGDGAVYLCCTSGGVQGCGQVFKLTLGHDAPDELELFAESPGRTVLDMPDNICLTPWGDLLVAEDGWGEQLLRGITPDGRIYDLARNAKSSSELTGVCASPDGRAVFVNLQLDGLTLAITGPFERLAGGALQRARRLG